MDSSNGKLVLAFNVFPDECGGVNEQSQAYPFLDDAVPGGRCGGLCIDPQTIAGRVYGELGVQPVNCLCAAGWHCHHLSPGVCAVSGIALDCAVPHRQRRALRIAGTPSSEAAGATVG